MRHNTNDIKKIINGLAQFTEVVSICIVGSSTRDYLEEFGDLDILVMTESLLSEKTIRYFLITIISKGDFEKSDDIIKIKNFDIPISVAFLPIYELKNKILDISNGNLDLPIYKPWSIFGYVPEVLFADIVDSEIICDKNGEILEIKKNLNIYPENMRRKIIHYSTNELYLKYDSALKAANLKDAITSNLIIESSLLPLLRGLFAFKKEYFRGMKYLNPQINKYLPEHLNTITVLACEGSDRIPEKLRELKIMIDEIFTCS